MRTLKAVS